MTSTPARTVLLTGASGVIGRAVAEELRGDYVIGLAHRDTEVPQVDELLPADLAAPRLGLDTDRWRALAERADVIIHSGALTDWGQPRERYQAVNIDGTATVIELARLAGAPVHLVSTCFVHAIERDGLHLLGLDNVVAPYIWSKLESERLLAASGVPHTIYRPTNLVGDSRTGASHRPQIVQAMSDWFCRGKAPYFPVHPGNLVDVVSLDVTATAIARGARAGDLGRLYWLTSGAGAMTADEALDILLAHARESGRDIPRPPLADPAQPLPVPLERVPATSRTFLKVLIDVSEVTRACGGALPTSLPELRQRLGVPVVSDRDAYRTSLQYWAKQRSNGHVSSTADPTRPTAPEQT
jgi:nucleoside-diphosphate-sugar epimerase